MSKRFLILFAILTVVLCILILLSVIVTQNDKEKTRAEKKPAFCTQTIPLLKESIGLSSRLINDLNSLTFGSIFNPISAYIGPDNPSPGIPIDKSGEGGITIHKTVSRNRREQVEPKEGNANAKIIISETNLESGKYDGYISDDGIVVCGSGANSGKIDAYSSQIVNTDESSKESNYVATGATTTGTFTYEQKESKLSAIQSITIPKVDLKSGKYCAFSGESSSTVFDNDGNLLAVLIGENDEYDLYIITYETKVIGTFILGSKKGKLQGGGKVIFSERTLKEGAYVAFNGLNSAFIFDNGEIAAVIIEKNKTHNLYIAVDAIVSDTPSEASLKSGNYKALISASDAIILDKTGKPIDVNVEIMD